MISVKTNCVKYLNPYSQPCIPVCCRIFNSSIGSAREEVLVVNIFDFCYSVNKTLIVVFSL